MKTRKFLTILTLVVLLAITATTVWAATSPYIIPSGPMTDPLDPSVSWWRDTANQNAIAQHSADEFTGQVSQVYSSSKLKVLVYSSINGPNVTALIGPSSWWLVGPGGGRDEANAAKMAFQYFYPKVGTITLKGILLTGASPEEAWGTTIWRNAFRYNPPFPIYANAAYPDARASWEAVAAGYSARHMNAMGPILDWDTNGYPILDWGADGTLGAGSMNQYKPIVTYYIAPDQLISSTTSFNIDSVDVPLNLIPGPGGSLMIQLPNQAILAGGDFGKYLPEAASIYQPGLSAAETIALLDQMLALNPSIYVPLHGQPVTTNAAVVSALTAQRDALQSIIDQTITQINQGATLDEAAAAVTLSSELAASPYNQEFVSTIPAIVKAVYQQKMGWFGGNVTELASTLTETAKAQALAAAFAYPSLAEAAKQVELSAQDLPSAEKALYLAFMAYKAAPDDFTVQAIYAQALRKNAFMQKSAQVRNTYLSVAQALGWKSDFTKTGVQDAPIIIDGVDFAPYFSGFIGTCMSGLTITSLPPAETGILTTSGTGGPVITAGQEFGFAGSAWLTFTPAAGWYGTTSFTWHGTDNAGYRYGADATVTLQVTRANHAPVLSATPLADVTADEDAANSAIDLSSGFSDADGDPLTYTIENSNAGLVAATLDGATLTLAYAANANGAAAITVTATDPAGASASDDFAVTVNPLNEAPTAADASITMVVGQSQSVSLDYGDLETAQADLTVAFGSLNGTLDASALPALTYTAPTTAGDDSFTYTVTDRGDPDGCTEAPCAAALSATATIHVTVLPESSISGLVFNDANGNGTNDGEAGLAGVTVQLQNPDGSLVASTATAGDGTYAFAALQPGAYRVRQVLSAGYLQTTPDPADVTVDTGQAVTGVDFGAVFSADLKVAMTSAYNAKSRVITYTIIVTNDGPADATASTVIDDLSGTVSFLSVTTSQGTCTGGKTVTCDFGTLATGSSATVVLKVNRLNTKAAITNTATVSSSIFDINLANNSVTVTTP